MAQSKSFFGLRRGSTKSHTYQVYRGVQVTKDRVYDVANPQTEAQMKQRLLLPMVANAASILKGIVNHSFEGIEYGDKSVRYFRQINLRGGALDVISYVPKGMMNCGVMDFQIAKGTLPGIGVDGLNNSDENGKMGLFFKAPDNQSGATAAAQTAGSSLTEEELNVLKPYFMGSNDFDQVTFVISYPGNDYTWTGSDGNIHSEPYNRFFVSRLIFDPERFSENADWKWKSVEGSFYLANGYMMLGPISELNNESGNLLGDTIDIKIDPDGVIPTSKILMGACITSKLDGSTWRRNNAYFYWVDAKDVTYNDVINTYLNASEGAASTKYLNVGNTSVDIAGGDTLVNSSSVKTKGA